MSETMAPIGLRIVAVVVALVATAALFWAALGPYQRQASGSGEITSFYDYELRSAAAARDSGADLVLSDPMTMYSVEGLTLIDGLATTRRWIRTSEYTEVDRSGFDALLQAVTQGGLVDFACGIVSQRGSQHPIFIVSPRTERWASLVSPEEHFVVSHGPPLEDAPQLVTAQLGTPTITDAEVQVYDISCS